MSKATKNKNKRSGERKLERACPHHEHPAWCCEQHTITRRNCYSDWGREVQLTLPDAARTRDDTTGQIQGVPVHLDIFVTQREHECTPRVVISPDPVTAGTRYELTGEEARLLGQLLIEAVLLIDGHTVKTWS